MPGPGTIQISFLQRRSSASGARARAWNSAAVGSRSGAVLVPVHAGATHRRRARHGGTAHHGRRARYRGSTCLWRCASHRCTAHRLTAVHRRCLHGHLSVRRFTLGDRLHLGDPLPRRRHHGRPAIRDRHRRHLRGASARRTISGPSVRGHVTVRRYICMSKRCDYTNGETREDTYQHLSGHTRLLPLLLESLLKLRCKYFNLRP